MSHVNYIIFSGGDTMKQWFHDMCSISEVKVSALIVSMLGTLIFSLIFCWIHLDIPSSLVDVNIALITVVSGVTSLSKYLNRNQQIPTDGQSTTPPASTDENKST
jgi:uncharacterized membrane protein YqhA